MISEALTEEVKMKATMCVEGIVLIVVSLCLAGCSTIFGRHQDEQQVYFDANVPEVEVVCSGKKVVTPGSLPLRQSKEHACIAQKKGYEKKVFRIQSGLSWSGFGHSTATNSAAWGWWTLGIGTGIGWLVDLPSGAMKNLKEDSIYVEMSPLKESVAEETVTTDLSRKIVVKTTQAGETAGILPAETVQKTPRRI